jgi:hypothetical protein
MQRALAHSGLMDDPAIRPTAMSILDISFTGAYLKLAYRISYGLFEGISLQQSNESQASFETEQAITQQ